MVDPAQRSPSEGVLGVLVAYRPGAGFKEVLRSALRELPALLLWDNSESPEPVDLLVAELRREEPMLGWSGFLLERPESNQGLSVAYNRALRLAEGRGTPFVLLLDQDSALASGTVRLLLAAHHGLAGRFAVGAVNAHNLEQVEMTLSPKTALGRLLRAHDEGAYRSGRRYRDPEVRERRSLINSGALLPVAALLRVGGFDERLFLDAVDYDLSLRLRAGGFRLFEATQSKVEHRQGESSIGRLAGREFRLRTYSAVRSYHLVRDTTVCARRDWHLDRGFSLAIWAWMWIGTLGAVALLPERALRLRFILRGLHDSGAAARLPVVSAPAVPAS
jgi:rhamnosyltransferase